MNIAIFACILIIVAGAVGTVTGFVYTCQKWWEMGIIDRIASIIAIACCVAGIVSGFAPWC